MLELMSAMGVILLQRTPLINRLNCVRNAGTVQGALSVINKALAKLEKVEARNAAAAERTEQSIVSLQDRRASQLAESATAAKVKGNLAKLVE